jgi:predicted AlkP superfamily pyrophosphatase or phosphodiesterase
MKLRILDVRSLAALAWAVFLPAFPPRPAPPKLVLVISVDQLSEDLARRHEPTWKGGLGRVLREGAWFMEAYHDHAFTETAPGHSVLLSGRTPGHTGILENVWFDRPSYRKTSCVEDESVRLVDQPGRPGASNRRFLGSALGDWLQEQVRGSRAFSIAGKDRAAILMAGRHPSAVFWISNAEGFTTSTAYASSLPLWLKAFNQNLRKSFEEDNWTWTPLRGTDGTDGGDRRGPLQVDGRPVVQYGAFPRPIQSVGMDLDEDFFKRFRASPFLDGITLDAAEALIEGERLGRGPSVDRLTLGLSSTDYVGHAFGPHSMEMQDNLQRLDQRLGVFLDRLHRRVPNLWVVLTADHGGLDIPERLQAANFTARRIEPKAWVSTLNAQFKARLHMVVDPIRTESEPQQLYLDHGALEAAGLERQMVARMVAEFVRTLPEVKEAVTGDELVGFEEPDLGDPKTNSLRARLKHSFHPDRSGDVLVAFTPLSVTTTAKAFYLAGHGTPYDYDRRVPLVFWGPWAQGVHLEHVRIVDLAPTLGQALGIHPSEAVDGKALELPLRPDGSKHR